MRSTFVIAVLAVVVFALIAVPALEHFPIRFALKEDSQAEEI